MEQHHLIPVHQELTIQMLKDKIYPSAGLVPKELTVQILVELMMDYHAKTVRKKCDINLTV